MTISEYLTTSPQTKRRLAERSGYSERDVELLIHGARLDGLPIVSDDRGYWFASTSAEVRECADRLRRRYINQALTVRSLRRAARRLEANEAAPLAFWTEVAA